MEIERSCLQKTFKGTIPKKDSSMHRMQRIFQKKSLLEYHMNSAHLKVKGYKCYSCPKRFITKLMLQGHIEQKHLKIKPEKKLACTEREASFENINHLEDHSSVHMNVKLYKCSSCPKYFTSKSKMMKHHRSLHE